MPDRNSHSSPFLDAAAVDAWDASFRLRENGELRDLSIESTWQRVADAIALAEPAARAQWSRRIFDAQANWRIIFDERVLARAGTARPEWPADPVAVLDPPSFVIGPFSRGAQLDEAALCEAAELAVRCLDDICVLHGEDDWAPSVGVIGVADALAMLGLEYSSDAARRQAGVIAKTIAEGCLAASVWLARERGPRAHLTAPLEATFRERGLPAQSVDDARQFGLRHARLTFIRPQPRLALFANNVADALDPIDCGSALRPSGWPARPLRTQSYAATIAKLNTGGDAVLRAVAPAGGAPAAAQRALRLAMQPWTDAPIDYPLCAR